VPTPRTDLWPPFCVAGYSAAALLAILFAIPFSLRLRIYKDSGRWSSLPQALYHEHLELFLGNACLGNMFPSACQQTFRLVVDWSRTLVLSRDGGVPHSNLCPEAACPDWGLLPFPAVTSCTFSEVMAVSFQIPTGTLFAGNLCGHCSM
jgi:hypothetical protein